MFNLIAKALRRDQADAAAHIATQEPGLLRTEVEALFRSDMDRFTRIALDRRARKACAA